MTRTALKPALVHGTGPETGAIPIQPSGLSPAGVPVIIPPLQSIMPGPADPVDPAGPDELPELEVTGLDVIDQAGSDPDDQPDQPDEPDQPGDDDDPGTTSVPAESGPNTCS